MLSGPGTMHQATPIDAVLLDMDGTIVNSIRPAERIWGAWALRHGLDVDAFLPTIHGMRSVDTVRRLGLPGIDPDAEAAAITQAEIDDVEGTEAIAGAPGLLAALPGACWAVVTSAPRALAMSRIAAAGLPIPPLLVCAEDVARGKPAPDGFQLAAARLGTTADRCLVFEDAPAGIAAAENAGARVVVVTATHAAHATAGHPRILDYRELVLEPAPGGSLWIRHAGGNAGPQDAISFLLGASDR